MPCVLLHWVSGRIAISSDAEPMGWNFYANDAKTGIGGLLLWGFGVCESFVHGFSFVDVTRFLRRRMIKTDG
jgi:hypothetical protein